MSLVNEDALKQLKGFFTENDLNHIQTQIRILNKIIDKHKDGFTKNKEVQKIIDELLLQVLKGNFIYRPEEKEITK